MKKTLMMLWMAVSLMVSLVGCSSEEMDYENPDVTVFVKQLKAGTYNMKNEKGVVEVPHFTEEDIPELLKYAEDLTIIPSFPSVYNTNNGKIRLGECMLWVIESIRQGTAPSLGCRMVLANAENYEAIYTRRLTPGIQLSGILSLIEFGNLVGPLALSVLYLR